MQADGVRQRAGRGPTAAAAAAAREQPLVQQQQQQQQQEEEEDSAFACNICLERVSEPVVTVCGHLYCWGCLYRWMENQRERAPQQHCLCPVCKAALAPDSIIPLYVRGAADGKRKPASTTTDTTGTANDQTQQSQTREGGNADTNVDGTESKTETAASGAGTAAGNAGSGAAGETPMPARPAARRPEQRPPPPQHAHHHAHPHHPQQQQHGFGPGAGPGGQFGNMTFSAGFGFFPSLFGLQFQSFSSHSPPPPGAGPIPGDPNAYAYAGGPPQQNVTMMQEEIQQAQLSRFLFGLGVLVVVCLTFF